MNIMHMKYAVEIDRTGSINSAAESLHVSQPNLSRAVKELENSIGISIFVRTSKGIITTVEGERFLRHARKIIKQIEDVERIYKKDHEKKASFSVSVPRVSYIAEAFSCFSKRIEANYGEIFYRETSALSAIKNVTEDNYNLGIIRYAKNHDEYFKAMLGENGLSCDEVASFTPILLFSANSPLAKKSEIHFSDLTEYIGIAHSDLFVPVQPVFKAKGEGIPTESNRRIFVFERASQFELLSENNQTFIWVSPVPDKYLKAYNLVQRKCTDFQNVYKDVLIYNNDYVPTKLDNIFIEELKKSKEKHLNI